MKIEYLAKIERDEDGFFCVSFPDIDEALTQGETLEAALFNASEALSLALECRLDDDEDIPESSGAKGKGFYPVAPDVKVQAALLVRKARKDRTLAELARALETSWPSVKRLENPRNSPTLKMIDRAAAALGRKLVLSFE